MMITIRGGRKSTTRRSTTTSTTVAAAGLISSVVIIIVATFVIIISSSSSRLRVPTTMKMMMTTAMTRIIVPGGSSGYCGSRFTNRWKKTNIFTSGSSLVASPPPSSFVFVDAAAVISPSFSSTTKLSSCKDSTQSSTSSSALRMHRGLATAVRGGGGDYTGSCASSSSAWMATAKNTGPLTLFGRRSFSSSHNPLDENVDGIDIIDSGEMTSDTLTNSSPWKFLQSINRGGGGGGSASSSSSKLSRRERQRERERRYFSSTHDDETKNKKKSTKKHGNLNKNDVDKEEQSTTMETVSTSPSSFSSTRSSPSSPPPPLRRNRMMQSVRTGFGNLIAGTAFVGSSVMSLLTFNRDKIDNGFTMPLRALRNYLEESGVDTEMSRAVNRRLATNLALLGRVNMYQIRQERREKQKKAKKSTIQSDTKHRKKKGKETASHSLVEEARRYMRYATAVYGQAMIRAAEVDARGVVDPNRGGIVTRDVIGHHISVPPEDIVLLDVDYDGDTTCLRHMLAVDHQHEKVVLSIRGTFSLSEIVVDVVGFTRSFCGGEAHTEMANYAERVWDKAGPTILESLEKHKGYELIVTGHSLGAGAACLLTVLLESKKLLPKSQKMRCFSYASPPVFTPLEFVPKARSKITNFIHQNDAIPFLSVDSVRHLFQDVCALDEFSRANMSRGRRYKVILGTKDVPSDLVGAVVESEGKALEPKKGAPVLYIPAQENIWLQCEDEDEEGEYFTRTYGSRELVKLGIKVHPEMLLDHFPARYEHAFDHLVHKSNNMN